MRYAKVSHVMYQSCFISYMLNANTSKNQKRLMPMIPNTNTWKCQSFWRSEMSSFKDVNMNCAQYQWCKVPLLISICFTLTNRVEYQLFQSQKWQYHLCGDALCARPQCLLDDVQACLHNFFVSFFCLFCHVNYTDCFTHCWYKIRLKWNFKYALNSFRSRN